MDSPVTHKRGSCRAGLVHIGKGQDVEEVYLATISASTCSFEK